ncbi:alpha/beta hydrolase [Corallococcus sp. H22C18031201]|nr:alpha/beta hydrolase [Corallococcus sp. H22C18031201]
MRPRWLMWLLAGVLGGCAVVGVKAWRTYRYERAALHPAFTSASRAGLPSDFQPRDVTLTFDAGAEVQGWYVAPRVGSAIVLVHGSPSTRLDLVHEAAALARRGHGVLLLDMPGHGESPGPATWGAEHRAAVRAGLDFLAHQPEVDPSRLGLFGFSMGSAVAARVASEDARVAAVALAGAFTRLDAQLTHEFGAWGPVTSVPAVLAARHAGLALDDLRPEVVVGKLAPRPLLLIAGTEDRAVPPDMARRLFSLAGEPRTLLLVPGAGHGHYAQTPDGDAYLARVGDFFDKSLAPREPQLSQTSE